jgi:hypothetical protein
MGEGEIGGRRGRREEGEGGRGDGLSNLATHSTEHLRWSSCWEETLVTAEKVREVYVRTTL